MLEIRPEMFERDVLSGELFEDLNIPDLEFVKVILLLFGLFLVRILTLLWLLLLLLVFLLLFVLLFFIIILILFFILGLLLTP